MNLTYPLKHWAFTLALAPLLLYLYQLFNVRFGGYAGNFLQVYFFTLLFSVFFSIPALIIYLLVYFFLKRKNVDETVIKLLLIALSTLSIVATLKLTLPDASVWDAFSAVYIISNVIGGVTFEIDKTTKASNSM
ncbi:MAG: hypothetical protein ACTHLE_24990 [Agriterribacter sp.]